MSTKNKLMATRNTIQIRIGIMLIAVGIVYVAVYSLHSQDILVRNDVTRMPESKLSGESPVDGANRAPAPQSVPPALQKGFLR